MDLGAIMDVAIGIIFVWIVLSLTTIQIQEWIATRLDKRASDMKDAIEEMLANENLKAQFYDHPVIRGLTARKRKEPSPTARWLYRLPLVRGFTKEIRKFPSYIPTQQFSLALFDIVMSAGTEASLVQQGLLKIRHELQDAQKMSPKDAVITELNILIEFARSAAATDAGTAFTKNTLEVVKREAQRFAEKYPEHKLLIEKALQEASIRKGEIDALLESDKAPKPIDTFNNLRRGIVALSVVSPEVTQTLNALLLNVEEYTQKGESQLAKARQNVEKWFDDSMDRVSGVFKRYSQKMAFLIGLSVALLLNVDSINLTLYLWRDAATRQLLVAQAMSAAQQPDATPGNTDSGGNPIEIGKSAQEQLEQLNLPVGWGISPVVTGQDENGNPTHSCRLFPDPNDTFGVPLPQGRCLAPSQADDQSNLFTKFVGIFITALAAMQGAPFWFDMLKRVVNLRGTGPNPAEKK